MCVYVCVCARTRMHEREKLLTGWLELAARSFHDIHEVPVFAAKIGFPSRAAQCNAFSPPLQPGGGL